MFMETAPLAASDRAGRGSRLECVRYFVRGDFSLSDSGCLSVTVLSCYLMSYCPVYPAVSRNKPDFPCRPGLLLRVPVFPASCAVAGARCLILRNRMADRSRLSLNIADGNDVGGVTRTCLFLVFAMAEAPDPR